jgi:hypothetical protein
VTSCLHFSMTLGEIAARVAFEQSLCSKHATAALLSLIRSARVYHSSIDFLKASLGRRATCSFCFTMLLRTQFGAVKAAYEPIPTAIRAGLEQSDWPGVMTLVQGLDLVSLYLNA